ncbi:MAG: class I SAM-dependent methyltransferase [Lentisphaeria bacterium]|nr:class I SAM-dependent methyltransferase [Lentisphaeria bacterium]
MECDSYRLVDAGNGRKLEQFGAFLLDRPCAQAVWKPRLPESEWRRADASFTREGGTGWSFRSAMPQSWPVCIEGFVFELRCTDFGHVGVFPEQVASWRWLASRGRSLGSGAGSVSVLNLFAYSGGATLAAARAGFPVCHLDASPKMCSWASRNAAANGLDGAPIRWICDDVRKFLRREQRRGHTYGGILLDPPSYGRGRRQELFKIDSDLLDLLDLCRSILDPAPRFVFLSCHTPGYTPLTLKHLLSQALAGLEGTIETGEMVLEGQAEVLPVPSGTFGAWGPNKESDHVA